MCEMEIINYLLNKEHFKINPLNAKLNPICHLLALLGAHPIFHGNRIRVKTETYDSYRQNGHGYW
jgi:hypothetical protein